MKYDEFHIYVTKDLNLLTNYGFIKETYSYKKINYAYITKTGKHKISVRTENYKGARKNQMVFEFGPIPFNTEIACLFIKLVKDDMIDVVETTQEQRINQKINRLQEQLNNLKKLQKEETYNDR